jgi:hypothetical protein
MKKLCYFFACILALCALTVNANAQPSALPGTPCYPFPPSADGGTCMNYVLVGLVNYGGLVNPQRWETRVNLKGVDRMNPTACVIHETLKVLDPNPLPITLGGSSLDKAKLQFVNYIDNRGFPDRKNPRVSDGTGISYDLKNGESVDVTILSSVDNPDVVKGSALWALFLSTPTCLSGLLPMELNYLAEQPIGYTFNVFKSQFSYGAPKWYFTGEGTPQGSPAGFIDMSVNVFNPSTLGPVFAHIEAFNQFGTKVAFTGTGGASPDILLGPLASWSSTLSAVLGSAVSNFSGLIEVSSAQGLIQVTAFRRNDLGMSAPPVFMSLY